MGVYRASRSLSAILILRPILYAGRSPFAMWRRIVTSDRPVILADVAMVCVGISESVVFLMFGKVVPLCCFAWKLE